MIESCHHVNYLSDSCTVRELPGCFECDTSDPRYKIALCFHWICSTVSGIACTLFILKVILAPNAVLDMLKNPTTSTPVGVWCLAMVGTFAGVHGTIGEVIVFVTSSLHAILAFWYLYTAFFKFRLWADPGWFPNVRSTKTRFQKICGLTSDYQTVDCWNELCSCQNLHLLPRNRTVPDGGEYAFRDCVFPAHYQDH